MIKEINSANFEETVKSGIVLADFWAPWCGQCKMLMPSVEQTAKDFEGKITVVKVNVDECRAEAAKYMVASLPTLILFKNGEPAGSISGMTTKGKIAELINSNL